jgi:hypothetical protein
MKMKQDQIEKHSMTQSVILHVLPGGLVGCFYLLARQPVANMGFPSIIALILAFALILIPVELGYLLYQGKKTTGRFTLQGIISYRNSIPWWQYLVWVFIIFIAVGAIFTLFKPVDAFLQGKLFFWMPDINYGLDGFYSRKTLIVTYSLALLFVAVLSPLVKNCIFGDIYCPECKASSPPCCIAFCLRFSMSWNHG